MRGFDANRCIRADVATAFFSYRYRFCVRYLRRSQVNKYDLTTTEAEDLMGAGLALSVVQHVDSDGWQPTGGLGERYGDVAVSEAQ